MLNLNLIKELRDDASLMELFYTAQLLNVPGEPVEEDLAGLYLTAAKRKGQAVALYQNLRGLHQKLSDFAAGKFGPYFNAHCKYSGAESFDPYHELRISMNCEVVDDLPEHIEQYAELVAFAEQTSLRSKMMIDSVRHLAPNFRFQYRATNEEGNPIIVFEDHWTEDQKNKKEVEQDLHNIEVEHCLDKYNAWYQAMMTALDEVRPFAQMLSWLK
ncbi:hypothetical protein GCM10027275_16630 [Rhabdobacter roseus]|uniref:Uncharacterized protein n=1 Tax=Rhabdobacter roseus TaxID=1655419 RepID=A0A840TJH4_9BACT|nr:hypothetical protein [Rhabdobacter roseus]MBB5283584.1 hypothetical protein [Rhabdobacter roseus]